jgi:hypothetical protein
MQTSENAVNAKFAEFTF